MVGSNFPGVNFPQGGNHPRGIFHEDNCPRTVERLIDIDIQIFPFSLNQY